MHSCSTSENAASNEPDTLDDIRHLAVSYRLNSGDIESVGIFEARFF